MICINFPYLEETLKILKKINPKESTPHLIDYFSKVL